MRRTILGCLTLVSVISGACPAFAQDPAQDATAPVAPVPAPVQKDKKDEHPRQERDGIVFAFDTGFGLARAAGYPNNEKLKGDAAAFSSSNTVTGAPMNFFIGGSLHDQINFGLLVHAFSFGSQRWHLGGGSIGFRVDTFPFFTLVPALRNLAIFGQGGVGFAHLHAKPDVGPQADTVQSYLGIGAYWEFTLLKFSGSHFAGGPQVVYDSVFSRDFGTSGAAAALRLVFYTGK